MSDKLLSGLAKVAAIGSVDEGQLPVGAGAADQIRLVFDNGAIARLAFAQSRFHFPTPCDITAA